MICYIILTFSAIGNRNNFILPSDKTSENSAKKGAYQNAYFLHFWTLCPVLNRAQFKEIGPLQNRAFEPRSRSQQIILKLKAIRYMQESEQHTP